MSRSILLLVVSLGLSPFCQAADRPLADLLGAVSARDQAIQSMTLRYQTGLVSTNEESVSPYKWPNAPKDVLLSVFGDEWIVRYPGTKIVSMHRTTHDATLEPYIDPEQNSTILELDQPFETIKDRVRNNPDFHLLRAGRFPWAELQKYVEEHQADVVDRGIADLDGIVVRKLELSIPSDDYKALVAVNPEIAGSPTMVLKFSVAEDYGSAIARVDYCLPDGTCSSWFQSRDFREVSPGIWFPFFYVQARDFRAKGKHLSIDQYVVESVTNINVELSEELFQMQVPSKTAVIDGRSKDAVEFFTTTVANDLANVEVAVQRDTGRARSRSSAKTSWRQYLIYGNIVVVASLAVVLLFRSSRNRRPH